MKEDWIRVSRSRPCPVCSKPDWCMISRNGQVAICPRVKSDHNLGEAGYLHKLADPVPSGPWRKSPPVNDPFRVDFAEIALACQGDLNDGARKQLSEELGVSQYALVLFLDVGWSVRHHAFTFPMRDGKGNIIGIRLRGLNGDKWAVKGSRSGLFYGDWNHLGATDDRLFICEGPTDAAALFDMGYQAVGRPSCMGGVEYILELLGNTRRDVVIVADNDPPKFVNGRMLRPGRNGADALARRIRNRCRSLRVIEPYKAKDVRAMVQFGQGREQIEQLVQCAMEWRPI